MSVDLGAPEGGFAYVTDFPAPFTLQKLQWRLSRAPAGRLEDVDVMTFHFIKSTGGTPGTWNDSTDCAAVETAIATYTGNIGSNWFPFTHSDQYRWYRDGPAYWELNGDGTRYVPVGDNPAYRVTEVDQAGTASGSNALPPQVAITVTEKTSQRKHWGRWYIPMQLPTTLDATGLLSSTTTNSVLTNSKNFYNACRAASCVPVVFCIPKPARHTSSGGSLAATPGVAYEVTSLQVDDIIDIIRSRRYKASVTKVSAALT
jgi:hypothetical protein